MVDAVSVPHNLEFKSPCVLGAKIVHRQYFQVFALQLAGKDSRQSSRVQIAVGVDKLMALIKIHDLFQEREFLFGPHRGGLDGILVFDSIRRMFPPKEVWPPQQIVERLKHLHITVQIDATVIVQRIEPYVVGGKGPFLGSASLFHPRYGMDVEAVHVPKHELVIRELFLPALHAALDQLRVRVAAQPAVMYNLGYGHKLKIQFLA